MIDPKTPLGDVRICTRAVLESVAGRCAEEVGPAQGRPDRRRGAGGVQTVIGPLRYRSGNRAGACALTWWVMGSGRDYSRGRSPSCTK